MSSSGSMFLVEIIAEELRSFVKCKDFIIKSEFADIFSITLKDPNDQGKELSKIHSKRKSVRNFKDSLYKSLLQSKPQTGQSVLFASDVESLVSNMNQYPIELSLWSKLYPEYKLASTSIPWNKKIFDFLYKLQTSDDPHTVVTTKGQYNVFDEFTSRRMASVKLSVKLNCLTTQFKALSEISLKESIMYKGLDYTPSTVISSIQNKPSLFLSPEETGIIKTTYSGGKQPKKSILKMKKRDDKLKENIIEQKAESMIKSEYINSSKKDDKSLLAEDLNNNKKNNTSLLPEELHISKNANSSLLSLVKSQSDLEKNKQVELVRSKSCSSMHEDQLNILNYIFGDNTGPFGNQVYCVSYFTVENDKTPSSPSSPKSTPKGISETSSKGDKSTPDKSTPKGISETSSKISDRPPSPISGNKNTLSGKPYTMKLCNQQCQDKPESGSVDLSNLAIDIPVEASNFTEVVKCKDVVCEHKKFRVLPAPPDDKILIDLSSLKKDCCVQDVEKVEHVIGGVKAKIKIGEIEPCYCECECQFGFMKKTTFCKICRGYEKLGDEGPMRAIDMPYPCPVYHKLMDRLKPKPSVISGSDLKRGGKPKSLEKKSIDSEKETKKGKKKKKEDKFKFNYGYQAAHIGHSNCALPCTGTMGQVPRNMGWLWTAENIPGMKFRPAWKPGAVNKHVLRLLRIARNPDEAFAKKKRKKSTGKPKRPLKRPLLTVHKKDGEYTVNLETMKSYNKPRAINQVPYEDKDPLTYTVGRTDEENYQRRKKKERMRRRLERDQREFIQSAFRDMCEEICLKTYQQALGILPDAEKPDCTCYPAEPGPDRTDLDHSCSCSEDSQLSFSDTDSDEWLVEITPPIAAFDPTYKTKKITMTESAAQYTYLDYRVKLLDRYGNPVPRFFIGPDGKKECSDLGGFWSVDHKEWLEINIDGYIGPDGRWAPNTFLGPNGETIDAEIGKFQAADGTWLVVGIDGYVDVNGKWRYYSKTRDSKMKSRDKGKKADIKKPQVKIEKNEKDEKHKKQQKKKREKEISHKKSEATWSCFGDASAKYLSEMGIMGHGHDRQLLLDTLKKLIKDGENVKLPKPVMIPHSRKRPSKKRNHLSYEDTKCRHARPSSKGVIAVDEDGNKIYFRIKDSENTRPTQRIATLTDQGISLSSFHVPCFHSFINSEMMKRQVQRQDTRSTTEKRHYRNAFA